MKVDNEKPLITGTFKKCEVQFFIEDLEFELSLVLNRSVGYKTHSSQCTKPLNIIQTDNLKQQ